MAKRATALTGLTAAAFVASIFSNASAGNGTAEQRWACEQDAFTFCSSEIPDEDRITACMARNLKKLSPPCRAQFRQPAAAPGRARSGHEAL